MPRRRALQTMAAALAMGAVELLKPRRAAGYTNLSLDDCKAECGPVNKACCVKIKYGFHHGGCCTPLEECCTGPNSDGNNLMSWCCPKGTCGQTGQCIPKLHCEEDQEQCGRRCCGVGQFCGSSERSLCCMDKENVCVVPGKPLGLCCAPERKCCFNELTAKCCDVQQVCVNGMCRCKDGDKRCGDECCTKGMSGPGCCKEGEICARLVAGKIGQAGEYSGPKLAPDTKKCCPSGSVVMSSRGYPVCNV